MSEQKQLTSTSGISMRLVQWETVEEYVVNFDQGTPYRPFEEEGYRGWWGMDLIATFATLWKKTDRGGVVQYSYRVRLASTNRMHSMNMTQGYPGYGDLGPIREAFESVGWEFPETSD